MPQIKGGLLRDTPARKKEHKLNIILCCLTAAALLGLFAWRSTGGAYQSGGIADRPWVLFTSGRSEGSLDTTSENVSYTSTGNETSEVCLAQAGSSAVRFHFTDPRPPATVYFGMDQYAPTKESIKRVTVNGSEVTEERLGNFPDFQTTTWDISSRVHPGSNEILVLLAPESQGPLWIRGAYVAPDNSLAKASSQIPDSASRYLPVIALICLLFLAVAGTYLILSRTIWKHVDLPVADSIAHSVTCMVLACCLSVLLIPQFIWLCLVVLLAALLISMAAFVLARDKHVGVRKVR